MPALKKVLITGGGGFLGQYLNIEFSKQFEVLSVYHNNSGNAGEYKSVSVDITDKDKMKLLFETFRPEVVIHTASVSNNELAAKMSFERVIDINVNATEHIAELSGKYNSRLFYTSTDLVYDGSQGAMLKETSELNPVSLYAQTKLEGEKRIKDVFNDYVILRVALLYGRGLNHSTNHFQKMYESLKEGWAVRLFSDQFRTPLYIKEAAEILRKLIKTNIITETVNFGGKDRLSRYQLGELLCEKAGFSKDLLIRTSMYDIADLPKVADVSMNTDKLQAPGIQLNGVEAAIEDFLREHTK